jgi:hypothetical protein
MSAFPSQPPTQNLTVFNDAVYQTSTQYLTYPVSQGSETISGTIGAQQFLPIYGTLPPLSPNAIGYTNTVVLSNQTSNGVAGLKNCGSWTIPQGVWLVCFQISLNGYTLVANQNPLGLTPVVSQPPTGGYSWSQNTSNTYHPYCGYGGSQVINSSSWYALYSTYTVIFNCYMPASTINWYSTITFTRIA